MAGCGVATLAGVSWAKYNSRASNDEESFGMQIKTRPGLEDYKLEEVAKHKNAETGVWVTYNRVCNMKNRLLQNGSTKVSMHSSDCN